MRGDGGSDHREPTVHVVGAGLSGLSAAVRLVEAGAAVRLYEGAGQAGGRCRSYHDKKLDRRIDNGNHLLLSGNASALGLLRALGAEDGLVSPVDAGGEAAFPFIDLATGERWKVRMNTGPIPWWAAVPSRRIPNTRLANYAGGAALALAGPGETVAGAIRARGPIWRRFWEPITWAVVNETPERASARLLWAVFRETFLRGAAKSRPLVAREGLGPAFVDPALRWLADHGTVPEFGRRLRRVEARDGRISALDFGDETAVPVQEGDAVVIATPATKLPDLLRDVAPRLTAPGEGGAILNAHFLLHASDAERLEARAAAGGAAMDFLGLLSATTHWIFRRGDVVSLTISAADALGAMGRSDEQLIETLWSETRAAIDLPQTARYAEVRLVKEKRATADQSPDGVAKRPSQETELANLFLAGDAVDTGLPATIEASIRSGEQAARLVRARMAAR